MNPDIKARWVAALRSGEYQQGREYLNNDGKFCCLGVLCEIAVQDGVIRKWDGGGGDGVWYGLGLPVDDDDDDGSLARASNTELPVAVADWAGLGSPGSGCPAPDLPRGVCTCDLETLVNAGCQCTKYTSLVALNDETTIGFKGIADQIEVQL